MSAEFRNGETFSLRDQLEQAKFARDYGDVVGFEGVGKIQSQIKLLCSTRDMPQTDDKIKEVLLEFGVLQEQVNPVNPLSMAKRVFQDFFSRDPMRLAAGRHYAINWINLAMENCILEERAFALRDVSSDDFEYLFDRFRVYESRMLQHLFVGELEDIRGIVNDRTNLFGFPVESGL